MNQKPQTPRQSYRKTRTSQFEHLERRQMMAANTVVSLPFRLNFDQAYSATVSDIDGQGTGFTRVQGNKLGTEYQQDLIDLNTIAGHLAITSSGSATTGSNAGADNTQTNALETQFDGTTSGFTINTRLVGPLSYLNDPYEQAGIYLGPDQDNYVKLVAIRMYDAQYIQFKDEVNGVSTISDNLSRVSIGNFSNVNTLDLRLVGDAATGAVSAYYSVNGGAFVKFGLDISVASSSRPAFFNEATRAGLVVSHKNNVGPITARFDSFEITPGASVTDRPSITGTRPGSGSTNVSRDSFIAADLSLPNSGGVNTATLTSANVKLYKQSNGQLISGAINTTGGGDAIVFTPLSALEANTTYVFEVTDGVKDTSGASFLPFVSTFTTGTAGGTVDTSVSFTKAAQSTSQGKRHTSLVFGPDGKLYATTIDGKILRYTVGANGTLSAPQEILTIQNREGGRRSAIGIAFDPASTASNLIAYISHSDFAGLELKEYANENLGQAQQWTGKITKVWGTNLQNSQDVVVGLPRSVRDHQNYSLAFGPDGKLYVSQSSMSAMGAPDSTWGNKAETLLSASILQIDTAAIGTSTINVRTEGLGANNYNPYAANAPVKLYATGLRSAYDILFHSNGKMYSATNGSAAGGNTPAGGGVGGLTGVATQPDLLFRVDQGKYYGHPNPLRGEYVLNGGNPTNSTDPGEVSKYTIGTDPDADWGGYAYNFGFNYSPNGMIEYKGSAFGGALDGKIMIVRYSGGDDILVMDTNATGGISGVHSYAGLSGFVNPLDIAQDPATGNLYVIEFGDQATEPGADARITMLSAVLSSTGGTGSTPSAVTGTPTVNRRNVYLSDQNNTSASSFAQNVRLSNTGAGNLVITGVSFGGTNASEYTVRDPYGNVINGPITLAPGQWQDFYITFKATSGTTGIRTATMTITTDQGNQTVNLRALALAGTGGTLEPSLQRILDLYQIGINVGDNDSSTTDFPVDTATSSDEVTMPRLVKSGTDPVTVEVLGVFANQNAATIFGWYEAGNPQTKYAVASIEAARGQSIAPLQDGKFTFDPGAGAFGIYSNFTLGSLTNPLNRDVYSENVLNTWETNANRQKKVRFYQYKENGTVVPNAYVVAFEEYNVTFDQNDIVAIIRNVSPAAAGPEIGLENRDNVPAADFLTMSRIKESGWNASFPNQFHDRATLRIRNTGSQDLVINDITIGTTDFIIESGGGARTLAPNAFVDVVVKFVYDRTSIGNTVRFTTMFINSNDADEPTKYVSLRGLWQSHSEDAPNAGSQEPNLQNIINSFGYQINVGTQNTHGVATRAGEEVLSELWTRADAGLAVKVTQLAAYHQQYNEAYSTKSTVWWYNPANIGSSGKPNVTKIFTHSQVDSQSLLPRLDGSTTALASGQFIPTSTTFGFRGDGVWSEDKYNTPNDANNPGHGVRFYQVKDASGNIIPDTYIMAQDYVGVSYANYDYQDNVYLITNIKPVSAPSKPSTPTATGSGNGIQLNWTRNTEGNVTGYNVYRASALDGTYVKITDTPITANTFLDTLAPLGATSYYKITAVTYQGSESDQSAAAFATRSGTPTSKPTAPSNANALAQGPTSVIVTWADNSNNETSFRVERSTNGGAWSSVGTVGAGVVTYTDGTVVANTSYTYRVVAVNGAGDSPASNESTTTTPAASAFTSVNIGNPTPTPIVTTINNGSDYDVTGGGVDIYGTYDSFNFLYQQRTGDFDIKVRINELNATDTQAMAGLMVRESLTTGAKHAMIKARPTGYRLNYRSTTNGATDGVGSGATSFPNVWVRMQRVGNTINTFTSSDGVTWTAFATVNISFGSTVYVGLATASHSNSAAATARYRSFGDTGTVQPPTQPAQPTGLGATAQSQTSVGLTWLDNASNETGYRVERKTGNGAWGTIANLGVNASAYTDNTVVAGTTYTYRVIAVASTDSLASNEATVTTPSNPNPGTGVTVTPSADGWVSRGTNAGVNYGSDTGLRVKYSTNTGYQRESYIKFNISSLSDASTIKLRLWSFLNTAGTVAMRLHGVSDTNWSESLLTYNNKPAAGSALGTASVTSTTGQWIEFDVTAYVKAALTAGKTAVTFNLQGTAESNAFITVASRESGANAPQLTSDSGGTTPTPTAPAQPTGLAASAVSQTSVQLNWTDNATNETGYRVERKTGSGAWGAVATLGANANAYTDNTVVAGTTYTYRVIAAASIDSLPSNESTTTTPPSVGSNVTLGAIADGWVSRGPNAGVNYGTDTGLRVKYSTNTAYQRESEIKFDISSLSNVTNAKLRLFANLNSGGSVAMRVYGASNAWDEGTLTYNNKPAVTTAALATATVTSTTGEWIEIDLTAYIQQAITNGQSMITLNFQGVAETSQFITLASRESGATAPQLVVS